MAELAPKDAKGRSFKERKLVASLAKAKSIAAARFRASASSCGGDEGENVAPIARQSAKIKPWASQNRAALKLLALRGLAATTRIAEGQVGPAAIIVCGTLGFAMLLAYLVALFELGSWINLFLDREIGGGHEIIVFICLAAAALAGMVFVGVAFILLHDKIIAEGGRAIDKAAANIEDAQARERASREALVLEACSPLARSRGIKAKRL